MCKSVNSRNFDKINFIYRDEKNLYSSYNYFGGLKTALQRNGLLYYAYNVYSNEQVNLKELLKYPILCITGSHEPIFEVVQAVNKKQFMAEINPESLYCRDKSLPDYSCEVKERLCNFDIYFSGVEVDLQSYWGKPCYWLPYWVHTEILDDIVPAVSDKIGFIGSAYRRKGFFSQNGNGIVSAVKSLPKDDTRENVVELCKLINNFKMLVNPLSLVTACMTGKTYEYMACKRLSLCQFDQTTMFKTKMLFEDGKDIVYFQTFEEMEDKYNYYIKNEKQRAKIALAGYKKVRRFHNADLRAIRLAQIVLHHANGGKFMPEFNDISRFNSKKVSKLFPVSCMLVNDQLYQAIPHMHEYEAEAFSCCFDLFDQSIRVLEWGSGDSTLYFSKYLQKDSQWDSIEHSSNWAKRGVYLLEKLGNSNINVHFVPSDLEYQEGGCDGDIQTFRSYVLFPMQLNTQFEIIIVDGRARVECIKVGWYLLKKNGIMILHDAQREEYKGSLPKDSCYLRLVNTRLNIEGNVSLLFICQRADTISKIKTSLEKSLPQHIRIDSNLDDFLVDKKVQEVSKSFSFGSDELNVKKNKSVPQVFTIETILACNLKCPECAIGGNLVNRAKGFMKFDQFRIIAEKIQPFVKLCYLFNWGEPLLNPDIFKIIDHAASNFDAHIVISTNGLLLNEKTSQLLIDSGVSEVLVSIDGTTQEVYEKYRIGGNVEKALSSLMVLQETNLRREGRVKISPQFIVFKHNQHEMQPFKDFCRSIGLSPFFKSPYIRNGSKFSDSDYPELRRKRYPDIQSLRHAMRDCRDPREVFTINMDGSVVVCCNDYDGTTAFGNIFRQNVKEIWNSEQSLKFRNAIVQGNAPQFCIDKCMVYLPDESKEIVGNGRSNDIEGEIKGKKKRKLAQIGYTCDLKNTGIYKDKFEVLFITTYYDSFIESLYQRIPNLSETNYEEQLSVLTKEFHGDSDFYSSAMNKAGLMSADLITNCTPLQNTWAAENNFSGMGLAIAVEQIRRATPQVLYFHDMNLISKEFLCAVRPYTKLIVGQIATPIFKDIPFSDYDVIFSSFPHYVKKFRQAGLTSYYQPLAFDSRILQGSEPREYNRREISCSFVGGISKLHLKSYQLLELLAKETPIVFWGYGANTLPKSSKIAKRHKGQAWGKEMFDILLSSQITINRHGEIAENYANNMRLYEATGTGTLLITDYKDNLNELFEIGKEIVAYRSPQECTSLVKYYLANPREAEEIAKAGQARTIQDHSYTKRMDQTAEILNRHLRYRKEKKLYPMPSAISQGHTAIKPGQVTEDMKSAWQSEEIPPKQRGLVQKELEDMYRNKQPKVYQILADSLRSISQPGGSILEIGCASGYYYEVLEYLLNERIVYSGVDYSIPLVSMGADYYPKAKFYAADGAKLPFKDKKFFVAISSCVLLHVPNYREHIRETVRVAQKFVVAHRTPVCRRRPTQHLRKFAYGIETVELIFNEAEIISEFQLQGLKLVNANEYYANNQQDHYEVTYLFERANNYDAHLTREKDRNKTIVSPLKIGPLKMLNLGCGGRYHKEWVNIDFNSSGPDVIKHNLCLGIPSPNETFDVVYHSDLLEHFPRSYAPDFLKECWRVLKPGGILRVVQPDLEQIVRLYLDALDRSLQGDQEAQKRYEWIVIELLDQLVRNRSGGEMVEYWKQTPMPAEEFVIERCGSEVLGALQYLRTNPKPANNNEDPYLNAIRNNDGSQIKKMSLFRMSGEVHQWMYDRYSLKKILRETGFVNIRQCGADESEIPAFNSYLLDIESNGNVRKPDSFFMEARKQP